MPAKHEMPTVCKMLAKGTGNVSKAAKEMGAHPMRFGGLFV